MEKKEMTLREAVQMLADKGIKIKWADGNDLQDFFSYFDSHYKWLLEELSKEWCNELGSKRFLASDMLTIFSA